MSEKINVEFYGTLLAWVAANRAITYNYQGDVKEALVGLFHLHKQDFPTQERAVVKQIVEVAIRKLKEIE